MGKKDALPFSWVTWPTLEAELKPHEDFLFGTVLNAGCGSRKITFPRVEKMIGVDIFEAPTVDIVANLEQLPFPDSHFDGILNIAVLEHCRRPWKIVDEFSRVLKKGGRVICTVPFLQPIHYIPTDYFRFTAEGIQSLFEDRDFEIIKVETTHSVFHTVGWIGQEIAQHTTFFGKLSKPLGYFNRWLSKKYSKVNVATLPNAITLLAQRK